MFGLFKKKAKQVEIIAPVHGKIVPMNEVPDPVFSEKMMGDGVAIDYLGGDVYAPISGTIVTVILPSAHAFGVVSEDGIEVLMHVGLETVNLKPGSFKLLKQQGDTVVQGDKIIEVNEELLKESNVVLVSPLVITNANEHNLTIVAKTGETVDAIKDIVLTLEK